MKKLLLAIVALALLIGAAVALQGAVRANAAMLAVNRQLGDPPDGAAVATPQLVASDSNARALREAGYLAAWAGEATEAQADLAAAGWTTAEFVAMAEHFDTPALASRALAWYALAAAAAPDDKGVWLAIGLRCQHNWAAHAVCGDFLQRNDDNRLVNADFGLGANVGWQMVTTEADMFETATCDGQPCGQLTVNTATTSPPAGMYQCLQLEPGQSYHFSVWVKTDTGADGQWRPVYVQGNRDGRPDGISIGDRRGARDWQLHEVTFVAQPFDEGLACFYPLRLANEGRAWIREPRVTQVEP